MHSSEHCGIQNNVHSTNTDYRNSILIIEHNLDLIKIPDHIIDLGPEGGINGGEVIAQGSVFEIMKNKNSFTGQYLKKLYDEQK